MPSVGIGSGSPTPTPTHSIVVVPLYSVVWQPAVLKLVLANALITLHSAAATDELGAGSATCVRAPGFSLLAQE